MLTIATMMTDPAAPSRKLGPAPAAAMTNPAIDGATMRVDELPVVVAA